MMINLNQASFLKESLQGEAEGEHSDVVEEILEVAHHALLPYEDLLIGTTIPEGSFESWKTNLEK